MGKNCKPKKLPDRLELLNHFVVDIDGNLTLRKSGKKVGWKDKRGYCHVRFKKVTYKMHRIIYKMWHGVDPGNKLVDHRDGDPSNNRISNLRLVRHADNVRNSRVRREKEGCPAAEAEPDIHGFEGWYGIHDF